MKPKVRTLVTAVLLSSLLLATVTVAAAGIEEPDAEVLMQFKVDVEGAQHTFQVSVPPDPRQTVFTQEQIELLRSADAVRANICNSTTQGETGEEGSYWAIEWDSCLCLRLHFSPLDATNLRTVVQLTIIWLGIAATIIGITTLGALAKPALIICGYIIAIIAADYAIMYSVDHNADASFDIWLEITWYSMMHALGGCYWGHTQKHKWLITPVGAYAYARFKPVFHRTKEPRLIGGHVGMDVHLK